MPPEEVLRTKSRIKENRGLGNPFRKKKNMWYTMNHMEDKQETIAELQQKLLHLQDYL